MKIKKMRNDDLLAVAKVHKAAFPRQLLSASWIKCNFNAYPRIRYFVAENQGIGSALISESLKAVQEELKQRSASIKYILVSTRIDNEAQKLYKKTLNAQPEAVLSHLFSADEVLMIARNPLI